MKRQRKGRRMEIGMKAGRGEGVEWACRKELEIESGKERGM